MARPPLDRIARALSPTSVHPEVVLLVGFSGGRDSVALVHWLLELGYRALVLCHLDHALREESPQDAKWCAQFAAALGLEFCSERVDVARLALEMRCGVEEAGREARYAFLGRVARDRSCERVALAHHADDQVETFLFRLLRGAGSTGLSGMSSVSRRKTSEGVCLEVLRPLLGVWRWEVDAYVRDRSLAFREDPSNLDMRWARNRIRHELLPEMERVMQRPVREALWRAAELIRGEAEALEGEDALENLPESLRVAELRGLPLGLRRRRVARWLRQMGVVRVEFDLVEAVLGLVEEMSPAKVNLPGGCHARRRRGVIFIEGSVLSSHESGAGADE